MENIGCVSRLMRGYGIVALHEPAGDWIAWDSDDRRVGVYLHLKHAKGAVEWCAEMQGRKPGRWRREAPGRWVLEEG